MSYKLITLTAGHNAIVPGASGCGYKEHEVARTIVAELEKQFKSVGQTVKVCTDNVGKTKSAVWGNAVKNCNKLPKDGRLDVSIHLNAFNGKSHGTEVLYYSQKDLAAKVSKELSAKLGTDDRGPKEAKNIGFLNSTNASSILIEVAFIDSADDMKKLMASGGIAKACNAIVHALTGKTVAPATPVTYKVVKGDTLWSIANDHKTTVDKLKSINGLKSDVLSIGQVLKLK
ncbi:N-acetylmuramoyl-L-alanine amidase [Priestia sp. YIM B13551]|uniref:N-acetylmuramoyl-L-alanine amidase n=1 Tax=Priestia sp. YIM B13551 TaxID=3366306 RepID=UPI0036727D7F